MAIAIGSWPRATSLALLVGLLWGCSRAADSDLLPPGAEDASPLPAASDASLESGARPEGSPEPTRDAEPPESTLGASDGAAALERDGEGHGATCAHCAAYGQPTPVGPVPAALSELSGLAASRSHPGRLYAHNDSGDVARIFVLDDAGRAGAELHLDGVTTVDWEDIAVGPCGASSCIFVGDIGDNKLARSEYAIYRVVEPENTPVGPGMQAVAYERFAFAYPDGPHNAETLLVHPKSGRVFVVIKTADAPQVFEIPTPLDAGAVVMAVHSTLLAHLPTTPVTGGSFHPCGDRILLRTYTALLEYVTAPGAEADGPFADEPSTVPVATELQGESVTYLADGLGYVTGSETPAGTPAAVLSSVTCR